MRLGTPKKNQVCLTTKENLPRSDLRVPPGPSESRARARKIPDDGPLIHRSSLPGKATAGGLKRHRLQALISRGFPPFPGEAIIPAVVVPAPRRLDSGMTDEQSVWLLAVAYRSLSEQKTAKPGAFMTRGRPQDHQRWPLLLAASEKLREASIPPAAWAAFSFSVWQQFGSGSSPCPAVVFVYSRKRLAERQDWYGEMMQTFTQPRVRRSPKARQLAVRWQEMWRFVMIMDPEPTTPSALLDIAERFLPGAEYDEAVEAATLETHRMNKCYADRVSEGYWE